MQSSRLASNAFLLELLNYQYGYIAWCVGKDRDAEAEQYLLVAEKNLSLLESRKFGMAYIRAYQSAFFGFRIGMQVFRAPFMGPKSIAAAENAIAIDPNNPMGYIQLGHAQYYMPKAFGGSKERALEHYLRAERLMAQYARETTLNWNYLNLLTIIALAYEQEADLVNARQYYEKILKTEPDYQWVRDELYPALLGKLDT